MIFPIGFRNPIVESYTVFDSKVVKYSLHLNL